MSPMANEAGLDGYSYDQRLIDAEHSSGLLDKAVTSFLPYSHSMDLHNDPRFFASNVIEKRLAAFSGLSVIASLTTGTCLAQCFALSKRMDLATLKGIIHLFGFLTMGTILFMSLASTLVFVYQAFFTHRLMTAGPNGFELASNFYLHDEVVKWRHFAVRCLGIGLPLLLLSTGCTLYVKICDEMPPVMFRGMELHPVATVALWLFLLGSVVLFYITSKHDALFHNEYRKRVYPDTSAGRRSERQEPFLGQGRSGR